MLKTVLIKALCINQSEKLCSTCTHASIGTYYSTLAYWYNVKERNHNGPLSIMF